MDLHHSSSRSLVQVRPTMARTSSRSQERRVSGILGSSKYIPSPFFQLPLRVLTMLDRTIRSSVFPSTLGLQRRSTPMPPTPSRAWDHTGNSPDGAFSITTCRPSRIPPTQYGTRQQHSASTSSELNTTPHPLRPHPPTNRFRTIRSDSDPTTRTVR